jgi:hypothetical protein
VPQHPTINSWTSDQMDRMKQLAVSGASAVRIASALDRSIAAVRVRANKVGIKIRGRREFRKSISEANHLSER